jgi:outer membrane protein assembly factor BamB
MDPDGRVYFSTLYNGPGSPASVRCYDPATNGLRWNITLPGGSGGSTLMTPLVDSAGGRIFIANDLGWILSARISDGAILWTNKCNGQIRAQLAYDETRKQLYVHSNDGLLLAFKGMPTNTGGNPTITMLSNTTSNYGPTPFPPLHPAPMSSGPVIAKDGKVYVGSSNGRVYGFDPTTLTNLLDVEIGPEIEAAPALGNRDDLYVATRAAFTNGLPPALPTAPAKLARIDLAAKQVTHVWDVLSDDPTASPGCVASPVLDRFGYVYATEWGHRVIQVDLAATNQTRGFVARGKLCQTPAFSHGNLLLVVSSVPGGTTLGNDYARIEAFDPLALAGNLDRLEPLWGVVYRQTFGSVNVLGGLGIGSNGRIWFGDDLGALYRVNGTMPLMGGGWTSLQGGNRRLGQWTQDYDYAFADLWPFESPVGTTTWTAVEAVGRHGYPVGGAW